MALPLSPPAPIETTAPGTVLRILVADADADMRLYLRSCLRTRSPSGYSSVRVHEATDGRETLHLARALLPDLVISDLVMPGLEGEAFCNALRGDVETAAIPILIISGETRAPPRYANGFLQKPFNATRLFAEVVRLLHS